MYRWIIVRICALFLVICANGVVADTLLITRSTHENISSGHILTAQTPVNQSLELNAEYNFSVLLTDSLGPMSAANVTWSITEKVLSGGLSQGAYFPIDGVSLNQSTVSTDENGVSTITLNSGERPSTYTIKAVATINLDSNNSIELTQSFDVVVGINASLKELTPERGLATSFDSLCPQLQENLATLTEQQQAILNTCNLIVQAVSEGKALEVSQVLRQMSPEEVAVQSAVGSNFTSQQISNISSRLSAVRRGTQILSFSNLMFSYDGYVIPLGYMMSSAFNATEDDFTAPGGLLSKKWGVFANGNVSVGNRNTTSREDGFEFDNYGITIGADYRLNRGSFVGGSIGISNSDVTLDSDGGDMSASGFSLGAYGTHYFDDQLYVDGVLNIGKNDYDMNRHIKYDLGGNSVDRNAKSNTSGMQKGISLGAGYEMADGPLLMTFYGRLNYTGIGIDGFSETGAQELNMKIGKQDIDSLISTLGAQLSYTHSASWGILVPFIWFSWEHEYSGESDSIQAAFVDDQFGSSFNIFTEKDDANFFSSGQGVSAVLPHGISLYVRMENIIGKKHYAITNVSFGGRIELAF